MTLLKQALTIVANSNLNQADAMVKLMESIRARHAYLTDFEQECLNRIVYEGIDMTEQLRELIRNND